MAAIDRLVHHSVILDMMSVESYRAEEASQHHLLSSSPKKLSSRQTSPDASSSISSSREKPEAPTHVVGASNAGIETHEGATLHRPVSSPPMVLDRAHPKNK